MLFKVRHLTTSRLCHMTCLLTPGIVYLSLVCHVTGLLNLYLFTLSLVCHVVGLLTPVFVYVIVSVTRDKSTDSYICLLYRKVVT